MKNLKYLTLATLLLTLALAVPAAAQPGPERGGPHGKRMEQGRSGPRWEQLLDLTAEQKETMAALRKEHRAAQTQNRKELMKLRHEIRGLMMEDAPDAKALEKLIRRSGDLKTEMKVARTQQRLEMRNLLTAEQRDQLLLHQPRRGDGPRGQRHGRQGCGI